MENKEKRPLVPNRRLYGLLDLDHHATSEDVVTAFEKVSLREQFHQAYVVLSDPSRKLLYDLGGEKVIDYVLSKSWGPLVPWLGHRWALRLYSLSLIVGAALLLIFFAFLAVKVDKTVSWSWGAVISPLLALLVGIWLVTVLPLIALVARRIPEPEKEGYLLDYGPSILNFITSSCYITFAALVATGLTDRSLYNTSGNWMNLFLLLLFGDVVNLLASIAWRRPAKIRRALSPHYRNNSPPGILVYGFIVLTCFYILLAVARWVVIGLKLDGELNEHSWYRIFIPILFRAFLGLIETFLHGAYMRILKMRSGCEVFFAFIGALFMFSLVIVSLYMLAAKLEGHLITMANVLVPMFVFCAYFVLAAIFTAVYLMVRMRRLEEKALHARMVASRQREYTDPTASNSARGSSNLRNRRAVQQGSSNHAPTYQHGTEPDNFDDFYADDDQHLSYGEEDEEEMEEGSSAWTGEEDEEYPTTDDSQAHGDSEESEEMEEESEYTDEEMEEVEVDDDDEEDAFTERTGKSPSPANRGGASRQSTPRGPYRPLPHAPTTHAASPVVYRERPASVPPASSRPAVSPMRHPAPISDRQHPPRAPSVASDRKRDSRQNTPATGRPHSQPRGGSVQASSRASSSRRSDRT